MRTVLIALFSLCLPGCDLHDPLTGPSVYLRLGTSYDLVPDVPGNGARQPWDADDAEWIVGGLYEWEKLGFEAHVIDEEIDASLSELPADVRAYPPFEEMKMSYIFVDVYRDSWLQEDGRYAGLHPRGERVIFIHAGISKGYLREVVAHELGHLLLDAGHLPTYQSGLMSGPSESSTLTDDDYAFACASKSRRCEHDFR